MRMFPKGVPLLLVTLVTLTACQDDRTLLTVDPPGDEGEAVRPTPPTLNPASANVEGYPTPGEIRTGFIYDRAGDPMEVTYEIHDGLAIWQGDIVLGNADEIATTATELAVMEGGPLRAVYIDGGSYRWTNGVIPYTIDDATPSIVSAAIQIIENQTPGVTLVPRSGEADYVTFRDGGGCSSPIGRQGGQQFITLKVNDGVSFCSAGNAAHEILHALGLFHEHTRCDRDGYVDIDYDEIESGKEGNFYKAGSGTEDGACSGATDHGAYAFGSMMHYPVDAFAIGSNPTIIPIVPIPPGVVIGQRSQVGPTDAATIDLLYGANNAAPVATIAPLAASYPEGSPVPFDASGSTDADDDESILTFDWSFGDGTCGGGTPPAACSDDDPDHPYADNGVYPYSVTVSDGFDDDTEGGSITIDNVPPSVDAGDDATVDEGSLFSQGGSFTDPGADTWTATVDYGEGDGIQGLTLVGKTFTLSHTYIDNGLYTTSVTVTDDDGGVGDDDVDVTVNNVAPTVDAGPDATVDSGETYDFSGTFSDPGIVDDPWSWTIDWGFGPDTNGQTSDQSAPIEASRQVCVAGTYTVTLTVVDKDGGEGSDDLELTVPYIPVEIDIMVTTDLNPVSLSRKGKLPVTILGSADLDVADVDPSTLTLGDESDPDTPIIQKNNGTYSANMEDVNGDGYMDLTTFFATEDLVADGEVTELTTELVLRGFLTDGCTNIRGWDVVTPVPE